MTDPVQVIRENEWLIDGWLSCPPFFSKSFYGNIQISTHPVQYDNVNLVLAIEEGNIRGALHYSDELLFIGDLCTDLNFGSIVVRLDGDVGEVRDRLLVAPATAAEDVEGVMKNLNLIWLRDFTGLWSLPR